jgi:hypothetical protein
MNKSIEDATEWDSITNMIEKYSKEGYDGIRVDSVVRFEKKKRERPQMDETDLVTGEAVPPVKKRKVLSSKPHL